MYPEQPANKNQKAIAAAMVVLAIIVVAVVVTVMNKKQTPSNQTTEATNTSNTVETTATDTTTTQPFTATSTTTTDTTTSSSTSSASSTYKDGTYTASDSYQTPGGEEDITVNVTLKGDIVSAITVSQRANNHDSQEYQTAFAQNYKSQVVGKKISAIKLSRVSGSSLTSEGFNAALEQIKTKAQS